MSDKRIPIEEAAVELERILYGQLLPIYEPLEDGKVSIRDLRKTRGFILASFMKKFWAEDVGTETVSYPENWIEALKERFFPKWLLKAFPVKMESVSFKFSCVYPDFEPSIPTERHTITVKVQRPL
tara:strand:- start:479 stop:856 length:378 start_codon:yes stop_codon:yes gene_type:complete